MPHEHDAYPTIALRAIKAVHTVVWAVFAGAIVTIPVCAWLGRFTIAAGLIAFVLLEVIVLTANRMRCPLTGVAARWTTERQDNFDIYLPLWIARYNKEIFGTLYVAGIAVTVLLWLSRRPAG